MLEELLTAILMLFVVLDAPGNAPLFYFFTSHLDPSDRVKIIRKSVMVAFLILLFFALVGDLVLKYFNITVDDFRIAGGTVLFIYAVLGLLGKTPAEEVKGEELAVVPLATPLLAGPGAITAVIYLKYTLGLVIVLVAIIVNMIIAWLMLENGEKLLSMMGRSGSLVLSKIFAILLAAYSIAIIREGIMSWIS